MTQVFPYKIGAYFLNFLVISKNLDIFKNEIEF